MGTKNVDAIYRWINPETGAQRLEGIRMLGASSEQGNMGCVNRFRDNGELKYSLRSLAMHAPWLDEIYIVHEGKPPHWLKEGNGMNFINILTLFKIVNETPQPNSETQKLYLSKIPNLAEMFIVFDDDWFLGQYCCQDDFFTKEGRAIHPDNLEMPFRHAPLAWTRSSYDYAIKMLPKDYIESVRHAGVSRHDPFYVMQPIVKSEGLVAINTEMHEKIFICDQNVSRYNEELDRIKHIKPKTYCINDDWSFDPIIYKNQISELNSFFEYMYPEKSPWEI